MTSCMQAERERERESERERSHGRSHFGSSLLPVLSSSEGDTLAPAHLALGGFSLGASGWTSVGGGGGA